MTQMISDVELRTQLEDGVPVLSVRGQVDLSAVTALGEGLDALTAQVSPVVVVDLGDVTFLDSQGLGALMEAQWRVEAEDAELRVVLGPSLRRVFGLAGLLERFSVCDTVEEALAGRCAWA